MERLPDQIAAFGWNMIVPFPKDHNQFALDILCSLQAIISLPLAEAMAVDIFRNDQPNPKLSYTKQRKCTKELGELPVAK